MNWGLNLGSSNLTDAYLEAKGIISAFKSPDLVNQQLHLDQIEIGNEPDLFPGKFRNSSSWTAQDYVNQ